MHGSDRGAWRARMQVALDGLCLTLIYAALVSIVGLGLVGLLRNAAQMDVGDVWVVRPYVSGRVPVQVTLPATVVSSDRLTQGASCAVGLGDAATGGTLIILRRNETGDYRAAWAGPDGSTQAGTDCGRSAELSISGEEIRGARIGIMLAPLSAAIGSL